MALDLEEQEQLDELKAWWKRHGTLLVVALTVFLVAMAGWRLWQQWTLKQSVEGSLLFDRAAQALGMGDAKTAKEVTGKLMEDYGRSAYATPAAWVAGRINHDTGDMKSAAAQYQYALDHAGDKGLEQLARLRLAAVKLDEKDYQGALKLIDSPHDAAFAGLYANLKGDVLAAQGKQEEARAAYKLALEKLGDKSGLKALVEVKLDSVGGGA